nr:uncharacterized protein LOC102093129 isoform X2 [Columba livia]XP_021147235.1 uncharacterized protein LOC102093129 isoform X2 [Columba livia]
MLVCSWIPTLVAQIPPSNAINWGLLPEQWYLWAVATGGSGAIWQVVLNCAVHMWHQHSPSKTRITPRNSFKGLCLTMCRLSIEGAHTNQTRAREESAKIGSKGEKKIQAAKPSVDTSSPAIYSHLHLKLGKLKLEEDRHSAIERENRVLLEKISRIVRTKGQIDNKNDYKAKSLNAEKRKQEQRRVSQENRVILDRITKAQPHYQVQRWHEDWQRAEKYMASIARYPRGQCKSHSLKEEQFKEKTPKQDRKRNKQLKEGSVKSKMKEREHAHHERRIVFQWVNELDPFTEDEFENEAPLMQ